MKGIDDTYRRETRLPGVRAPRTALALALALLVGVAARPASAFEAGEGAALRTIEVKGSAKVTAMPDRARLSVSVVTRAKTAAQAAGENAEASDAVLAVLRKDAGPGAEVSTGSYSLDAEYEYSKIASASRRTLTGYVASNTVNVVTADLSRVGVLIDAAVSKGANEISSLDFFLADEEAAKHAATLEAGRRALAEADTVAQSLGVGRGELLSATTEYSAPPLVMRSRGIAFAAAEAAPATPVVAGNVEVAATVTAVFAVR